MTRRLTKAALAQLNTLMAQGVAYEEALSQIADWEEVPQPEDTTYKKEVTPHPSTTQAQVIEAYDVLFHHMAKVGIVAQDPALGCTREEIVALEQDTQRLLPFAYTAWLERVGKARTRMISHNHIAAELHRLRQMQVRGRKFMAQCGFELPPTAFFMLSCLGDCYHYVECDTPRGVDALVWVAREDLDAPFIAYKSIVDMVQNLAKDAQRAWDSGYFKHRPEGTQA